MKDSTVLHFTPHFYGFAEVQVSNWRAFFRDGHKNIQPLDLHPISQLSLNPVLCTESSLTTHSRDWQGKASLSQLQKRRKLIVTLLCYYCPELFHKM